MTNITKAVYKLRYLTYTYIQYVMFLTIYVFDQKHCVKKISLLHAEKSFALDHLLDRPITTYG